MRCTHRRCDILIIGAGVVGCAIARTMAIAFPGKQIVVVEKNPLPGQETSRLNSNVIHSGLHESSGSLKERLARHGSRLIVEYALNNGLEINKTGMIIAVPWKSAFADPIGKYEAATLLRQNAKRQKINVEFLNWRNIKKYEPNIKAMCGVFIPNVWIVDAESLVAKMHSDAVCKNVDFYFDNAVVGIDPKSGVYEVSTPSLKIQAGAVVNAAGLYADKVAAMAGLNYQTEFWRGEYYEVSASKAGLIRRLVYPVISSGSPSKGIHFSPRLSGRLFIGPNARLVLSRSDYNEDKTSVNMFHEAASQFCPQIKLEDLGWAYSGIRPKVKNWQSNSDFSIKLDIGDPPFLNLIGIESPGLTASMAIAEYVEELLGPRL